MDAVSVSNQAGFFKKPNTVTQWDWTMCSVSDIMSVYVCVCVCDPLTSEAHSLIVIQLAHTNPSPFAGPLQSPCHRSSLPPLKQQQPFSCCLASPQARSSPWVQPQARPHNWRSVSVYSPFCPLSPVPLDDQALQPIPREKTSIMVKRLLQLAKQNGTRTGLFSTDQWIASGFIEG